MNDHDEAMAQFCAQGVSDNPEKRGALLNIHRNRLSAARKNLAEAERTVESCRSSIALRTRILELLGEGEV